MRVLGLLRGRDFSGSDGPDGLVGNHDELPVLLINELGNSGELPSNNFGSLSGLSLVEVLSYAEDDIDSDFESSSGLDSDQLIRLVEDGPALRVSKNDPRELEILELGQGDLSSVGSGGKLVSILSGDGDFLW